MYRDDDEEIVCTCCCGDKLKPLEEPRPLIMKPISIVTKVGVKLMYESVSIALSPVVYYSLATTEYLSGLQCTTKYLSRLQCTVKL